jgi:hypothetical protein
VEHQLLERAAPLRDDQETQGRAPGGERFLDRTPTSHQLLVGAEDVGGWKRWLRAVSNVRLARPGGPRRLAGAPVGSAGGPAICWTPVGRAPVRLAAIRWAPLRLAAIRWAPVRRTSVGSSPTLRRGWTAVECPRPRSIPRDERGPRPKLVGSPIVWSAIGCARRPVSGSGPLTAIAIGPIGPRVPLAAARRQPVSWAVARSIRNRSIARWERGVPACRPRVASRGIASLRLARARSARPVRGGSRSGVSTARLRAAGRPRPRMTVAARAWPVSHESSPPRAASAARRGCPLR